MNRNVIDGILILDKPKGITSNLALQKAKRLFNAQKAGHTGSLDPIATGLLPICFGEATKFSQFLLDSDKHYQVTALLGAKSITGDSEGPLESERPVNFSKAELLKTLGDFRGEISQIPPMYSALKHQGQPLYKLARQGLSIEREARQVRIYELTLLEQHEKLLKMEVYASKGTYIRTLVEDIGEALGCGAHVVELRRLGAGPYVEKQMVSLEDLESELAKNSPDLNQFLLPVYSALSGIPEVILGKTAAFYIRQGQAVTVPYAPTSGWVQLCDSDKGFFGVGEVQEDGKVAPRRLTQEMVSLCDAI